MLTVRCIISTLIHIKNVCSQLRCQRSKETLPRPSLQQPRHRQSGSQEKSTGIIPQRKRFPFTDKTLCRWNVTFMKNPRLILSQIYFSLPFRLLQKLCTIPEAANSEEVHEFLALNTDATAAFQKKPSSSRIDKVTLSWDMTYCT